MTAREDIRHELTRPKVRGVHYSPEGAEQLLNKYRTEVLREAHADIVAACPDHGDADEAWEACPCEPAELLRVQAELADPTGGIDA